MIKFKEPRNVSYDKEAKELYDIINENSSTIFYKKPLKDIFIVSMCIGYYYKKRKKLKKALPNINFTAFTQEEKWLLYAIGLKELGKISIDENEYNMIFRIAEEYANYGISILYEIVREEIEFNSKFEEMILQAYDEIFNK